MICSIDEVYSLIRHLPAKRVAVAQAADAHVLQAVCGAYREGYALPILIGNVREIARIAQAEKLDISSFETVDVPDGAQTAATAVRMVREGRADVVMKGLLDSSTFLRAVLNKDSGLRKANSVISAIAVVELKKRDRLTFITDPGITPAPDLDTKIKLLRNAVEVVKCFGVETPCVAAISASETVNEKMASSREAAQLQQMNENGEITGCLVAGPVSLDLAMSQEAASEKGYRHPEAGKADILLVPTVEVGNAAYKAMMLYADMDTGGIMAGTSAPVVFCSRADSAQSKKNTLALAVFMAARGEKHEKI